MQYIFILGRNPELSKEEVFCYLKKEGFKALKSENLKNAVLVDIDKELREKTIERLGGVIAIGKVLCNVSEKELESKMIYLGEKNNIVYVIWNFAKNNSYNKISDYLKKRFKEEKLKASEKPLTGYLELQGPDKTKDKDFVKISSGLIDDEYFVTDYYFGKIIEKSDYKSLEERDMKKPERRESLAISPRLAKIMINLSMIKRGETLLDPFCGVGVIIQEALLQGINAMGIDKDERAISGAKKNLDWNKFSKENYKLFNMDSGKFRSSNCEVIVTEPELGETLKTIPPPGKINNIIKIYEKLIFHVLSNLKNRVRGRIVFTAPFIKDHRGKRHGVNIEGLEDRLKLKMKSRFPEFRENHIVGREIIVLGKI